MRAACVALLLAIAAFSGGEARAASLLTNGGFEQPGFTTPDFYRYMSNGDTRIAGWTVHDDGAGEPPYWTNAGAYAVFEGDYAFALNDGASIETTFATVLGEAYRLTLYAIDPSNGGQRGLTIEAAGSSRDFVTDDAVGGTPGGYLRFEYDFVATSTTSAAVLRARNTADGLANGTIPIDAFSIEATSAVPEPTTAALALGAALAYAARVRRRSPA